MKTSNRDVVAEPRASGSKQTFDVIIVGGGSAGAVTGYTLAPIWFQPRIGLRAGIA